MKKITLALFTFLLFGCPDRDPGEDIRDIKIINKSNDIIYCLKSKSDSLNIYLDYKESGIEEGFKINKDSSTFLEDKPDSWDDFIIKSEAGKMRLFFIAKDSIDKYGWRVVLKKNIHSRVLKLDMNDLEKCNWQIIYEGK